MTLNELQAYLKATKRYAGAVDGQWGRLTEAAVLLALTDGPDTPVAASDFTAAGQRLGVAPAAIRAFWTVEAAGAGFQQGRPKILPERHYFSKLTQHVYDKKYPKLSYPVWGTLPYPSTQDERYDLLLAMVSLDVDAGFASCSYGAPQIMGANYRMCGFSSPFTFAEAMARDEATQLAAFCDFVNAAGITVYLRAVTLDVKTWEPIAARYNGPAYKANQYADRLRNAYQTFGGK